MGEITSINKATSTNESLRTTIPRAIVNQFGLTYNDKLEWIMKVENGELVIQVKPLKSEKKA
jgi:antitoxin component of MazEF toxin-antitoxin module